MTVTNRDFYVILYSDVTNYAIPITPFFILSALHASTPLLLQMIRVLIKRKIYYAHRQTSQLEIENARTHLQASTNMQAYAPFFYVTCDAWNYKNNHPNSHLILHHTTKNHQIASQMTMIIIPMHAFHFCSRVSNYYCHHHHHTPCHPIASPLALYILCSSYSLFGDNWKRCPTFRG